MLLPSSFNPILDFAWLSSTEILLKWFRVEFSEVSRFVLCMETRKGKQCEQVLQRAASHLGTLDELSYNRRRSEAIGLARSFSSRLGVEYDI